MGSFWLKRCSSAHQTHNKSHSHKFKFTLSSGVRGRRKSPQRIFTSCSVMMIKRPNDVSLSDSCLWYGTNRDTLSKLTCKSRTTTSEGESWRTWFWLNIYKVMSEATLILFIVRFSTGSGIETDTVRYVCVGYPFYLTVLANINFPQLLWELLNYFHDMLSLKTVVQQFLLDQILLCQARQQHLLYCIIFTREHTPLPKPNMPRQTLSCFNNIWLFFCFFWSHTSVGKFLCWHRKDQGWDWDSNPGHSCYEATMPFSVPLQRRNDY